jgi:hypothetical protein
MMLTFAAKMIGSSSPRASASFVGGKFSVFTEELYARMSRIDGCTERREAVAPCNRKSATACDASG